MTGSSVTESFIFVITFGYEEGQHFKAHHCRYPNVTWDLIIQHETVDILINISNHLNFCSG